MSSQADEETNNQRIVDRVKGLVTRTKETPEQEAAFKPRFKRVHVIINPAAGKDRPILKTLNTVFNDMNVDWDAFVTKHEGDAERMAREAVEAGVDAVAAYGGDGTVLEVASGLRGSDVPLCILPGGTGNVISIELGIPGDLKAAAALLGADTTEIRALDMGDAGGHLFFHLGIGIEGEMIKGADRESKDSSGLFAYILSALNTLRDVPTAHYTITLDGQQHMIEGVNCMITNFGSTGIGGLKLSHAIDMTDGLFDVIVIRRVDFGGVLSAATNAITSGEIADVLVQWQGREVRIEVDPPQPITRDGELLELDEIHAEIVPGAIRVIVPGKSDGA
ncbi:diacylglycerol/lipid kinase family protein [Aggregatilinea lenta]|uniref:diacylglycerol/lipid kinase family protein n=1 Tax=Aggregatilinea lenta TaxID=913108 RepID=UPI000E5AB995|nr:diacylglycerol kinase family protein [Aggregatilinea lenta]